LILKKRTLIILACILIVIAVGVSYGLKEFYRKPKDIMDTKAAFALTTQSLAKAFTDDEKKAMKMYVGKPIELKSVVTSIEKDDSGNFILIFSDSTSNISIRASLAKEDNEEGASVKPGDFIFLKGFCNGYNQDDLLGSDIILDRSAIIETNFN